VAMSNCKHCDPYGRWESDPFAEKPAEKRAPAASARRRAAELVTIRKPLPSVSYYIVTPNGTDLRADTYAEKRSEEFAKKARREIAKALRRARNAALRRVVRRLKERAQERLETVSDWAGQAALLDAADEVESMLLGGRRG